MDYSSKRLASGIGYCMRERSITFRDQNNDSKSIPSCNRLGCSTRHNSIKHAEITNTEKLKSSKTITRSSSKPVFGISSKTNTSLSLRKSNEQKKDTSLQKIAVAESSGRHDRKSESESTSGPEITGNVESVSIAIGSHIAERELNNLEYETPGEISGDASRGPSSFISTARSEPQGRRIRQTGGVSNISSSTSRRAVPSRNASQFVKSSQGPRTNPDRHGHRNLGCTSISDVLRSGSSSSSVSNGRNNVPRRRYPYGESPGSRYMVSGGYPNGENSASPRISPVPSPSIIERPLPPTSSQRTRNRPSSRICPASVRTRRSTSRESRTIFAELGGDMFSLPEPMIGQVSQIQTPSVGDAPTMRPFQSSLTLATLVRPDSSTGTSRRNLRTRSRMAPPSVDRSISTAFDSLAERGGYRHFNTDGIAEVLLALDRIEHDEELSYEQLLVLETNLLLGGLGIHDQHRDMRLDIDNMTYEELLALGEKMGTVSTALTEEALSKCLKRSIYKPARKVSDAVGRGDDDMKCSICQEEYAAGDEVGKLNCLHVYHIGCIHQWFQLKNWCPICKSSAIPS